MSIDNISFLSSEIETTPATTKFNKENHTNGGHHTTNQSTESIIKNGKMHDSIENLNKHESTNGDSSEHDNIIPWRAQLRKTNSRLSLVG